MDIFFVIPVDIIYLILVTISTLVQLDVAANTEFCALILHFFIKFKMYRK